MLATVCTYSLWLHRRVLTVWPAQTMEAALHFHICPLYLASVRLESQAQLERKRTVRFHLESSGISLTHIAVCNSPERRCAGGPPSRAAGIIMAYRPFTPAGFGTVGTKI